MIYRRHKSVYEGTHESNILSCLATGGALSSSQLRRASGLSGVKVKQTLSNLKRKGLVYFKPRCEGSSSGFWRITTAGNAVYHEVLT